jgi:hypothetical protein
MYTLEYFANNGELRKVEMNEHIPEERVGFVVENVVNFVFPEPGKYFPYWKETALCYFLIRAYSANEKIEEDMVELFETLHRQPEVWEMFINKTNFGQIERIYESCDRLLEYRLHRPEPNSLQLALVRMIDKVEKYIGSSKFEKMINKLGKTIEDTAKKYGVANSQE